MNIAWNVGVSYVNFSYLFAPTSCALDLFPFQSDLPTFFAAGDSKMGLWAYILKDFFPDVKMAYVAEECGCEYYCKFDETGLFYPHDYYVDIAYPGEGDEVEYIEDHQFYSLQDVHDWLDANLPFKYEKKGDEYELEKEINSKLDLYDSDEFFCTIAKYENISPSEFELKK